MDSKQKFVTVCAIVGACAIFALVSTLEAQPVNEDALEPPSISTPEPSPNPNSDREVVVRDDGIDPELGPIQEPDSGDVEPALRTTDGDNWERADRKTVSDSDRDKLDAALKAQNRQDSANAGIMPRLVGPNIPMIPISLLFPSGAGGGEIGQQGPKIVREAPGTGVIMTALNRETGSKLSFRVRVGQTVSFERVNVKVSACYKSNPEDPDESYAYVDVIDNGIELGTPLAVLPQRDRARKREAKTLKLLRRGWIIASSPTVTPIDHPIYDVWLNRCEGGAASQAAVIAKAQENSSSGSRPKAKTTGL